MDMNYLVELQAVRELFNIPEQEENHHHQREVFSDHSDFGQQSSSFFRMSPMDE